PPYIPHLLSTTEDMNVSPTEEEPPRAEAPPVTTAPPGDGSAPTADEWRRQGRAIEARIQRVSAAVAELSAMFANLVDTLPDLIASAGRDTAAPSIEHHLADFGRH